MKQKKVLLVDGMALLFRAFYATAMSGYYMINDNGIPTNAIHGFVRHLFLAINDEKPTHVICCWDMGSKTFRNEIYSEYKANRKAPPEQLIPQFDLVKDVTEAMNIRNFGIVNYEADDCIGTLASIYKSEANVVILTGDRDLLQIADEQVSINFMKKGYGNYDKWNLERVQEELGITPNQLIDIKALMGDSSDNYPGVRGIGEKTAHRLIKKYESIEGIIAEIESLTPAQRKRITEDIEMLHISRQLAEIKCTLELDCPLETAVYDINREQKRNIFEQLQLKNLENILDHYSLYEYD